MRTRTILITILLLSNHYLFGQITEIKKNLSELFYGLPISPSKFDVRTKFHGDNNFNSFYSFDTDKWTSISSKAMANLSLSYQHDLPINVCFWFPTGSEYSDSRKIEIEYPIENFKTCKSQLEEVYLTYMKLSYKTKPFETTKNHPDEEKGEKIGEGWAFFSSEKNFAAGKPFMQIGYRYYKYNSSTINEEEYIFTVTVWNKDLN